MCNSFLLEVLCFPQSCEDFELFSYERFGFVVFFVNFEDFIFDLAFLVSSNRSRFL